MSRRKFTEAVELVHNLLDRHEARPASNQLLAYLDHDGFASAAAEEECLQQLTAYEREGGIEIRKRRIDGVDRVLHVRLVDAAPLYRRLGRAPAEVQAADALAALRQNAAGDEVLSQILDDVEGAWRRNVSRLGIEPGRADLLTDAIALAQALLNRADQTVEPTDYRTFSRQVVGDSKALERLAGAVKLVLHRLDRALGEATDPFGACGVVRLPPPFLVSGPLSVAGVRLPDLSFIGLAPEEALALEPFGEIAYVLIIENYSSFVRHVREVPGRSGRLVIYSGGFPSEAALDAIVSLAVKAAAPTYHWGDLDPGGLRIFVHLERALGVEATKVVHPGRGLNEAGVATHHFHRISPDERPQECPPDAGGSSADGLSDPG